MKQETNKTDERAISFVADRGFTLIELLVVIAIIGMLAVIVLVSFSGVKDNAEQAKGEQFSSSLYHILGSEALGMWDLNGTVADSSGYGRNGSNHGIEFVEDRSGVATAAGLFDSAEGDYIDLGADIFPTGADALPDITISMWLNPATVNANKVFFIQAPGTERTGDIAFWGRSTNTLICDRWTANNNADRAETGTGILTAGQWQHVVCAWSGGDNGTRTMYLNGVAQAITSTNNAVTGGWNFTTPKIGGNYSNYYFNGAIDDVRVYGRALAAFEIQRLYAQGLASHLFARVSE